MQRDKAPDLIFLVGFMASGKTTWGNALSEELCLPCIDLDDAIISKAGKSIPEIFKDDGEEVFREIEAKCLRELALLKEGLYIIACGGGTPCFHDNMNWMNTMGKTIFLDVSPDTIVDRLFKANQQRPLIQDLEEEAIRDFILPLLEKRNPFYFQSHFIIREQEDVLARLKAIINYENP